jgi:hypothetical protein
MALFYMPILFNGSLISTVKYCKYMNVLIMINMSVMINMTVKFVDYVVYYP